MEMDGGYVQLRLPSNGKVYDVSKVMIRAMKFKDAKLLAEMKTTSLEKKFLELLKNVIKGIDPLKLTVGDRNAAIIWLALNSYGAVKTIEGDCVIPYCQEPITLNVDLQKIDHRVLPEGFKLPFPVKLPVSNQSVYLRLWTVEDEIAAKQAEAVFGGTWSYYLACSVVDESKTIEDKIKWLDELPAGDEATIRAFQEEFEHGPVLETKYTCPKCGGVGLMPVRFRFDWILPTGKALRDGYGQSLRANLPHGDVKGVGA